MDLGLYQFCIAKYLMSKLVNINKWFLSIFNNKTIYHKKLHN